MGVNVNQADNDFPPAVRSLATQEWSFAIGLIKEQLDAARGGSGFSFADLAADLARFVAEGPPPELAALLDRFEIDAMMARAAALLAAGVYPDDDTGGHRWPWPLI